MYCFAVSLFLLNRIEVLLSSFLVVVEVEQQVSACNISGSIALCSMCPVNDVSGAVVLYDNVGWVEIAVAYLLMFVHTLKAGVQLITCGGVEVGFADLAVHFVLQLVEHRALWQHEPASEGQRTFQGTRPSLRGSPA